MSELSPGWTTTTLVTLCGKGQYGWTTKAANEGSVKFLRTSDITKGVIDWPSVPYCLEEPPDINKYLVKANEILISRAGSVGFSTLIEEVSYPTVFASYLIRFVPSMEVNPRFVAYFLRSNDYWRQISDAAAGIALANVNAAKLGDVKIPIAPFDEQERIADKLAALLARVDASRQRLERVPVILRQFRQAVLASATSGRLTAAWRKKKDRSLSTWKETTVGRIIEDIEAGINVQCEERPPDSHERGLVKISAVTWGTYNDKESKTLPLGRLVPESTRIAVGDFLISRANTLELVGACVIVHNVTRPVFLSDKILRLKMKERHKKWLLFYLRSDMGRKQIEQLASGNQLSMRNLSQASLKSVAVRLPKDDEREEIVRRVETLFAYADRLETRYTATLAHVERLTPALLAKAFDGALVPQDPNDEPASVLLERIRAIRATEAAKPKATRLFKKPTTRPEVSMLNREDIQRTHLSDILKTRGPLTAETLWSASQLDIDDFYDQLRDEEARGVLREKRGASSDTPRLLEAA